MNTLTKSRDHDVLRLEQRAGEMITLVVMALFLAFLVDHQTANTGFFTAKFGILEAMCLYVPLILAFIAPAIRASTGRRNPARPFEVVTSVLLALGSLWLLMVFPFNFAHLADALPSPLHFLLAWVPDSLGKLLLLLQVIISPISALLAGLRFLSVRDHHPVTVG